MRNAGADALVLQGAKLLAMVALILGLSAAGAFAQTADTQQYSDLWIVATLQQHPELAIFLTLAIGYWIGAIKFGAFSLGAVTGTLLAGVLIGQLDISVSNEVKSIFFIMFLFAVGYGVGPQFVRGIAHDGVPQALFAVVICFLCLGSAYLAANLAGYDLGFAAGLYQAVDDIGLRLSGHLMWYRVTV
jgi:hypothetical protein